MTMGEHELEELLPEEDADGFVVVWVCDCGKRGTARDQPSALKGWQQHTEERDYSWCGIS